MQAFAKKNCKERSASLCNARCWSQVSPTIAVAFEFIYLFFYQLAKFGHLSYKNILVLVLKTLLLKLLPVSLFSLALKGLR